MKFQLKDEDKRRLIQEIQDFFYNERDEEIGIIAAGLVLDFMVDNIAGKAYNKGVDDAKKFMFDKLDDISIDMDTLYK